MKWLLILKIKEIGTKCFNPFKSYVGPRPTL